VHNKANSVNAFDLVQPVIFAGSPIQNAIAHNILLSRRAEGANIQHDTENNRQRRRKS